MLSGAQTDHVPPSRRSIAATPPPITNDTTGAHMSSGDTNEPISTFSGEMFDLESVDLSEKVKKEKKVLLRVSTKGVSRFVVVTPKE